MGLLPGAGGTQRLPRVLGVEPSLNMVWIDVIDNGPGIDEALLPRVFDRFFRANPDVEGSGLGLSIVKAIAARYGGDVTLRNRSDGQSGIVASISFPVEEVSENVPAPVFNT